MMKTELAKSIAAALVSDERTQDAKIEAIDKNGVITLTGTAPSNEAVDAAKVIAAGFDGVVSVTSDVEVETPPDLGSRVFMTMTPPESQTM